MNEIRCPVDRPLLGSYRSALSLCEAVSDRKSVRNLPAPPRNHATGLLLLADIMIWVVIFFTCVGLFSIFKIPLFLPNPWILMVPMVVSLFGGWLV